MTATAPAPQALSVSRRARWLVVRLGSPHAVLSWAIAGGGHARTDAVAWHQVDDGELRPPVDARELLLDRLRGEGLDGAVGLLTSRRLDAYVDVERTWGSISARCVATVGLGNALAVGDPPGPIARIGTINVVCRISSPLTHSALIEALAIAAEARTAAVLASGAASALTKTPATGTGTDCIVIAAPEVGAGPELYAGKHTVVGHLIGSTVKEAVARGASAWMAERTAEPEIRHAT